MVENRLLTRFEVLMSVEVSVLVFWDVTPGRYRQYIPSETLASTCKSKGRYDSEGQSRYLHCRKNLISFSWFQFFD
jgi:hypothetical protein